MCVLQGLKTGKNIQDIFFFPLNSVAFETSVRKFKTNKQTENNTPKNPQKTTTNKQTQKKTLQMK